MGVEYQSLNLEDQMMVDELETSPVLETSVLIKLGDDQERLAEYMCRLLFCFSFPCHHLFFFSSYHAYLLLILSIPCFRLHGS